MKRFFGLAKLVVGFLSLLVFIHNAQPQTGPGTALQFNGTNAYVWAPAALLSNKGLTVEAWVKPTNLTLVSQQVIVWQGSNGPTSDFLFSFEGYGTVLSFISLASNGATPTDLIITVPINPNALQDGNWHHLAATYAPTNCTRTLYLDGANLGVSLFGVTYPSAMLGGGVAIGAISNAPSTGGLFAGGIDEVRVWTTNRSAAQICQT